MTAEKTIWKTFNSETRKYEQVYIGESELLPGMTLIKMYWCNSGNCYVSVPGASLYTVATDHSLIAAD